LSNIGSPVVVLVDAGGFGGIAYALHVEHPNPQHFQLRIRTKGLLAYTMAVGDAWGSSSRFLFLYLLESWRLDLSFGGLNRRRACGRLLVVVSVDAVRRLLAKLLNVAEEEVSLEC